jgi:hypothetical protein
MKFYAVIKNGSLHQGVALDEVSAQAFGDSLGEGEVLIDCEVMVSPAKHYWDGETIVEKSESPGLAYFWDDGTNQYVYDIATGFSYLRLERNQKLSESDWTQVPDAPVDQQAWAVYRQQLRDLPDNTTDPRNPVWPTPPA